MKEDIEEKVASQLQKARSSVKKSKTLTPVQLFDRAVQAFKWWEHQHKDDKVYWTTLQHNGIIFQPPYAPHHVPLYYDGKPVALTAEQEAEVCRLRDEKYRSWERIFGRSPKFTIDRTGRALPAGRCSSSWTCRRGVSGTPLYTATFSPRWT